MQKIDKKTPSRQVKKENNDHSASGSCLVTHKFLSAQMNERGESKIGQGAGNLVSPFKLGKQRPVMQEDNLFTDLANTVIADWGRVTDSVNLSKHTLTPVSQISKDDIEMLESKIQVLEKQISGIKHQQSSMHKNPSKDPNLAFQTPKNSTK